MLCAQAWKPGSQHAGEKRGVAGLLLGRTERAARAALAPHERLPEILVVPREKTPMRNLYAGQEATVRTGHGTTDWFQIGQEGEGTVVFL